MNTTFYKSAAIGKGKTIFDRLDKMIGLSLNNSISFKNGIVMNHYKPKSDK
jgi:hypothetical protein